MGHVTKGFSMNKAPYGSWTSPVTPHSLAGTRKCKQLFASHNAVYFVESRPEEAGRSAICSVENRTVHDILPIPYSAHSKVHEYGGAPCCATEHALYFVHAADQNIHVVRDEKITPIVSDPGIRFADMVQHPSHKWLYAIQEEHTQEKNVINTLVLVHLDEDNSTQVVHSGHDFYSKPRLSQDGKKIAFIAWDHPHMPWDDSTLYLADVKEDGTIKEPVPIAGGNGSSVNQVLFDPSGTLYYTCDKNGWWDIYDQNGCILANEHDFGYPDWILGIHRLLFFKNHLIGIGTKKGTDTLFKIDPKKKTVDTIHLPYTVFSTLAATHDTLYAVASSPTTPPSLISIHIDDETAEEIHSFGKQPLEEGNISTPEILEENGVYGYFYPPKNKDYSVDSKELPPLIVSIHGGPTGHTDSSFSLQKQLWTTRGFAVLDVNHRGSTGNGRMYRDALKEKWGIIDVEDAYSLAHAAVKKGWADGARLVITGSSAGGFTALNCMAFTDHFACGISFYGIADLTMLAKETHKFESKTLESLVGPYPEKEHIYKERSALFNAEKMNAPLLLLQGIDDVVVPPTQSEAIYSKLKERGVPVTYLIFEGEGHGFRNANTIERAHGAAIDFVREVFSIRSDEHFQDICIENKND